MRKYCPSDHHEGCLVSCLHKLFETVGEQANKFFGQLIYFCNVFKQKVINVHAQWNILEINL